MRRMIQGGLMASVTVGQASKLVGCGKSTITRAIKAGRLSATRRDDGSYAIDVAELSRVYDISPETVDTVTTTRPAAHRATVADTPKETGETVALKAQVDGLKALVDEMRSSRDHARTEADKWREQAERLTMAISFKQEPTVSWWKKLVG